MNWSGKLCSSYPPFNGDSVAFVILSESPLILSNSNRLLENYWLLRGQGRDHRREVPETGDGNYKDLGGWFIEITKFIPPLLAIQIAILNTICPASYGLSVQWVRKKILSAVTRHNHKNKNSCSSSWHYWTASSVSRVTEQHPLYFMSLYAWIWSNSIFTTALCNRNYYTPGHTLPPFC